MFIEIDFVRLLCERGGAQPYLWMELLQIDDDTLAPNGPRVAAVDWRPQFEDQGFVGGEMKAGDSAPMPLELARLNAHFREGLMRRDLILVASLWDHHDTPSAAVAAGYSAFLSELRDAVADPMNLLALSAGSGPEYDSAIQRITKRVHDKVEAAITDKISWLDKAGIIVGLEDTDRLIDSTFKLFADSDFTQPNRPTPFTPFTLTFHDSSADFKLDAQLFVTNDPCEDELIPVMSLQQEIATMEGALKQLANAHGGEPRPEDEKNMERIEKDLRAAQAKLKVAQDAYERCRLLHGPLKQ